MATDIREGRFIPDYAKTVAAVYIDVARWCLSDMEQGPLDFLGHVVRSIEGSRYEAPGDLATWVPDWRCQVSEMKPRPKLAVSDEDDEDRKLAYSAAGTKSDQFKIQGTPASSWCSR
jgi:hypothetical protein